MSTDTASFINLNKYNMAHSGSSTDGPAPGVVRTNPVSALVAEEPMERVYSTTGLLGLFLLFSFIARGSFLLKSKKTFQSVFR